VTQWARLTLDRIGTNMKLMLERDEDDLLLDDDPIGEFLSRKERMTDLPEAEEEAVVEQDEGPADEQEAEAAVQAIVNLSGLRGAGGSHERAGFGQGRSD